MPRERTICFVTGTRADFGLMRSTLRAIRSHPALSLQLVVTGMHLDPKHGRTVNQIRKEGWRIDAVVPWRPAKDDLTLLAAETGRATARLAERYAKLNSDVVLVLGDRVEAFAAASAAHLSGRIVAHVHGGDRAQGQVDDALRHAITKLAHVHFPATRQSAERIGKLGEEAWRIRTVGAPGLDGIVKDAMGWEEHRRLTGASRKGGYALFVLHPTEAQSEAECQRAKLLLDACVAAGVPEVIAVAPNNDPGANGIVRALREAEGVTYHANLGREAFLGLLRDAAMLVGNSSSGIIEAASFGTPVLDVGPRQGGRERGANVTTVPFNRTSVRRAVAEIWNDGRPRRCTGKNIYGTGNAGRRIAQALAALVVTGRVRRKRISY
jgi:UDP-hydrolysing UDP-N-acetyl-D-glucosamine 2-epimerase